MLLLHYFITFFMLKFQSGWKLACKFEEKDLMRMQITMLPWSLTLKGVHSRFQKKILARIFGIFRPWMLNMRIDDTEEMSQSSEEEVLFE